jgi:hypothetical protein
VYARLVLRCVTCGSETVAEHAAYCPPRQELALSREAVAHFVDDVWPWVEDNAYRCIPFEDRSFVSFLSAHRTHKLTTRLRDES